MPSTTMAPARPPPAPASAGKATPRGDDAQRARRAGRRGPVGAGPVRGRFGAEGAGPERAGNEGKERDRTGPEGAGTAGKARGFTGRGWLRPGCRFLPPLR